MKVIFGIFLLLVLLGCATPRPNRVKIERPPDCTEEQWVADLRQCNTEATTSKPRTFGEFMAVVFGPPGTEALASREFRNREELLFSECMVRKGYKLAP